MSYENTHAPLPEWLDLDKLDEYARRRDLERRRQHYARHPEQVEQNRARTYKRFFNRRGYIVLDVPPAPPWSDAQRAAILETVAAALDQQKVVV